MEETKTKNNTKGDAGVKAGAQNTAGPRQGGFRGRGEGRGPGGRRRFGDRREKPEFDQKILNVRRVTRVMAGGRRFSFSVAVLIGDRKGSVGFGLGKSTDTTLAINKAVSDARKNLFKIPLDKDMKISHEVSGKFKASRVMLMPNKDKGLVAGGALREILLLAGVKNVTGKIFSPSKNHLNNAKATMLALKKLKTKDIPSAKPKEEKSEKESK